MPLLLLRSKVLVVVVVAESTQTTLHVHTSVELDDVGNWIQAFERERERERGRIWMRLYFILSYICVCEACTLHVVKKLALHLQFIA